MAFNTLVDARNALNLRKTITLTDFGFHLSQAAGLLRNYDYDVAAQTSIENKMESLEAEIAGQGMSINFYGLEHERSTCSDYGLSFLEENHQLYFNLHEFLSATSSFRQFGTGYLDDPPSLRDHRLLSTLG